MTTTLEPDRYRALIAADTARLLALAEPALDAAVPACPDWTVSDVVDHLAMVYAHKARLMADGEFPRPWPPEDLRGREPLGFLRESEEQLFAEFDRHDPDEQTATFGADTTIAFWLRRMALEVAVHRVDVEQAVAASSAVPRDLAVDGVDEVLRVMLGGPWWDGDWTTEHPVDARVAVACEGRRWVCALATREAVVTSGDEPADATVSGEPEEMFLWLWGRRPDTAVTVSGPVEVASEFRSRVAEACG